MTQGTAAAAGKACLTLLAVVAAALVVMARSTEADSPSQSASLEESVGFTNEKWVQLLRRTDREIKTCMAREGFELHSQVVDWTERRGAPHGLFEYFTPLTEIEYLQDHGYGIVARMRGLTRAARQNAEDRSFHYFESLNPKRKREFVAALHGKPGAPGCVEQSRAMRRLHLPSGGALGAAYGQAVGQLYNSQAYRDYVGDVIQCVRDEGIAVDGDELAAVRRPLLVEVLELTGSDYSIVSGGAIQYEMNAADITPQVREALPSLERKELEVARIDAGCRRQHMGDLEEMMQQATGFLVNEHPNQVQSLRAALAGGK